MNQSEIDFVSVMMPTLDERARHIFLGAYSKCLGRGGITDLSNLTGVSRATITTGQKDISKIKPDPRGRGGDPASFRIRAEGAGRKTSTQKYPGIKEALLLLLDGNIVGNPENPLCWTTKSLRNLADELAKQNMPITYPTVGTLLEDMGFSLQQNRKYMESGEAGPDRDEQFKFINQTAKSFLDQSLPVISVDTKKKELIGNYKNNGAEYHPVKSAPKVNDHDFPDPQKGKASPYGIYDIGRNEGFVNVGLSADTGAFAVNSIRSWWTAMGNEHYPDARKLMITADGGGSNDRRNKLWKTSLQEFANESRLEISVCHFPPGTSKWNKIEHRLFSQISKNWRGRPLETIEIIISLIGSTTTKEGLSVQCVLDPNTYEKGTKVTNEQMKALNLTPNSWHGEWNYTIAPQDKKGT